MMNLKILKYLKRKHQKPKIIINDDSNEIKEKSYQKKLEFKKVTIMKFNDFIRNLFYLLIYKNL